MGQGIALNLLKKGNQLTLLEHPGNQPLDELLELGARSAKTLQEIAEAGVDGVLLCVTGSPQVEAIVLGSNGDDGLLQHLKPGQLLVDLSTSQPASTKIIAAALKGKQIRMIDAAMTRTPVEARLGKLNLLVGGPEPEITQLEPILRCFAENIYHAGPVGSGHALKLLHNYVSLGSVALISEAAACASQLDVSSEVFVRVLKEGGGNGIALNRLTPYLLERDVSGLRFSLANAAKDLSYYCEMAGEAGVADRIAKGVRETLEEGLGKKAEAMTPELVDLLKK